jgi:hypothetical protein
MSYCPNCRQRFEDVTECPTDHVALVDELPYQTVDGPSTTWVEIESVGTEEEARLLQGFLEAEGIPCQVESLRIESMPANLGSMGEIRIYVAAESEETANELLRSRAAEYRQLSATGDNVITDEGPSAVADDAEMVSDTEE